MAPRINAGVLMFAAFLADFLLGVFSAAGLEQAHVPTDYATAHYLTFTFPYSHGLVPLIFWAAILGGLVSLTGKQERGRAFLVIGALVISHFVLDGLVHVAGLPIAGEHSPKVGLGLWRHMTVELVLETLLTAVCVVLYLRFIGRHAPAAARYGMPIYMALFAALMWTQLTATSPPKPSELTTSWLVMPILLAAIPFFLDRKRALAVRAPSGPVSNLSL